MSTINTANQDDLVLPEIKDLLQNVASQNIECWSDGESARASSAAFCHLV